MTTGSPDGAPSGPTGSTPPAPPPRGSVARRAARTAARPVTDPMHRRFDAIEERLDAIERLALEVRDRVEADLASIVELTIALQRALDRLASAADPATGDDADD
jgi:hypothetical protein